LWWFPALAIAKYGVILQNVALGVVSLLAWYVNRALLPRELRPRWFMQLGAVTGGVFFLGISAALLLLL
jgi:predicted permease